MRGMFAKSKYLLAGTILSLLLMQSCASPSATNAEQTPTSSPANTLAQAIERKIISVQQWGGTPADASLARKHSITKITLHHQGESFAKGRDPQQYLRNLQTWSRNSRKWLDIPYHYIIDLDGNIYEGRNINFAGDSNTDYDPSGHALIEVVGNFEEVEPNQLQLAAVINAMTMLAIKYHVSADAIGGHKDYSGQTVCPGKNLARYLQSGYFQDQVRRNLQSTRAAR